MMSAAAGMQGRAVTIAGGGYTAIINEVGANLSALTAPDGRDLILRAPQNHLREGAAGALLAPWPNRLEDGAYSFGGSYYQLPINEVDRHNAIHGLVDWQRWTLDPAADGSAVTARLELPATPGYPFSLSFETCYSVDENGLTTSVTARNSGVGDAPYALGAHPYLVADGNTSHGALDEWTVHLPVTTYLEVNERMLPTGELPADQLMLNVCDMPLNGVELDHAFGGINREISNRVELSAADGRGVALSFDHNVRWIQVYSDGSARRALAVEPMTAPANAFATGRDLHTLKPRQKLTVSWTISAIN